MKSKIFFLVIICFFSNKIIAQVIENVNPKGNWYFGLEIGTNKMNSFSNGEIKQTFQGGILVEYYFARHWSLSSRIKYFETGVSFFSPSSGGWFSSSTSYGVFKGTVVAIPVDVKWEFRVHKNIGASLKLGLAYTVETKSDYSNYSSNLSTDYPKQYGSFNLGYGFNYFINKKMAVYFETELYIGATKGHSDGFFGGTSYFTENRLINLGIKYNFKKNKDIK